MAQGVQLVVLAQLEVVAEVLVDVILSLGDVELLAQGKQLRLVTLPAFFGHSQLQTDIFQLLVQGLVGPCQVVPLQKERLQVVVESIQPLQLLVRLVHLLLVLAVESIIVRPQHRYLQQQRVVLLGEKVGSVF